MQNILIPESVENGYFGVTIEWKGEKLNIRIGIFDDKGYLVGTVYPTLDLTTVK